MKLAQARWLHELLYSPHPLREKLTLTWSGHFVVGSDKVRHGLGLTAYLDLLRAHGLSSFERLAWEVARAPAMLRYLDNADNKRGKPNENFSRELLELFTTGIGHYTEADVREGARALTGLTFRGRLGQANLTELPEPVFNRGAHDDGVKSYLGRTGAFLPQDVVRLAATHEATPLFVGRRLWRTFVNDTPDEAGVREVADVWRVEGGDLRAVMTALLTSEAFYAPANRLAVHRSPVEFVVGALRSLGAPRLTGEKAYLNLIGSMARMGQDLLHPPTVEGWKGGREWLSDAALLTRLQVAAQLTLSKTARVDLEGADLALALLGRADHPVTAAFRGLTPARQAYLMLASPEFALA